MQMGSMVSLAAKVKAISVSVLAVGEDSSISATIRSLRKLRGSEMSVRFYNHQNIAVEAGLKEAREKAYKVSVTTILSETIPKYGLKAYRDRQVALAARGMEMMKVGTSSMDEDCVWLVENEDDWLQRVMEKADEHREAAAEFGGELHNAIENALTNNWWEGKYSEWASPFMQWVDENVKEVIWTEKVVSSKLGYAGRADAKLLLTNDRLVIVDFKTQDLKGKSPSWYKEWSLQLEAYAKADEEDTGRPIDGIMSIVFDSKNPGMPKIREWPADKKLDRWLDFYSCLSHWQRMNRYYMKEEVIA